MKCGACKRDCRTTKIAHVAGPDGGLRRARVCGKCFDGALHIVTHFVSVAKERDETREKRRDAKDATAAAARKIVMTAIAYERAARPRTTSRACARPSTSSRRGTTDAGAAGAPCRAARPAQGERNGDRMNKPQRAAPSYLTLPDANKSRWLRVQLDEGVSFPLTVTDPHGRTTVCKSEDDARALVMSLP